MIVLGFVLALSALFIGEYTQALELANSWGLMFLVAHIVGVILVLAYSADDEENNFMRAMGMVLALILIVGMAENRYAWVPLLGIGIKDMLWYGMTILTVLAIWMMGKALLDGKNDGGFE